MTALLYPIPKVLDVKRELTPVTPDTPETFAGIHHKHLFLIASCKEGTRPGFNSEDQRD